MCVTCRMLQLPLNAFVCVVRSYDLALGDSYGGRVLFLLRCPHENDPQTTFDFAPPKSKGDGGWPLPVVPPVVPGG